MKNASQVVDYCYSLINEYNRNNNTNHSFCVEDCDGEKVIIIAGDGEYEIKCKISVFIRQDMIKGDVRRFMFRVEDKAEIKRLKCEIKKYKAMPFIGRLIYKFKKK